MPAGVRTTESGFIAADAAIGNNDSGGPQSFSHMDSGTNTSRIALMRSVGVDLSRRES